MQVGAQIGHYSIVEHIGRGGMADVWSARDERLQRTVAIKTIAANLTDDRSRMQFEQEARTIAALEHSNILPIYDFGEFERQLYIVMRYVSGGSLMDHLIEGPLVNAEVLRIGYAVAGALERAHAEHVVHRDLKPANVLLDRFGTPYLGDFGLAVVAGAGSEENISSGTLLYMPPEQVFGNPVDHRADIYAFAIMLFQMLTGEFPFEGKAALCLRQVQEGEELPDPRKYRPDLPEQVVTVLRVATAMDVGARYDSAGMLMAELETALQGRDRRYVVDAAPPATGPAQEPMPFDADTEVTLDEDLIVTMAGLPGQDWQETIDVDSSRLAERYLSKGPPTVVGEAEEGEASGPEEARRLYQRMVRAWARGQGRFLTGATHFANIHAYYSQAEAHGLEMDDSGREVMLRGAVEHNYALDFWLPQVGDVESLRIVLLHALRSDLASARALAVRLLQDVPDSEASNVAVTVGRLLHAETDLAVRRAIVNLLAGRAAPADAWRPYVYSRDTDLLLAEQALRADAPDIAETAARAIGRLRSLVAVRHIAEQAAHSPAQARAALAWVRDEADALPPEVPFRLRAEAFSRLTWRYLSSEVGEIGLRFFTALLGTGLGLGLYVHFDFNTANRSLFRLDHLYTVIGNGQTFGLVAGLGVMLAAMLPLRLAGSVARRGGEGGPLWRWWGRLLAGLLLGGLVCSIAYLNYHVVALRLADPKFLTALMGGMGLALGAALGSTFRWPLWVRIPAAALTAFLPLYHTCFNTLDPLIYFVDVEGWCQDLGSSHLWPLGGALALLAALGAYGPELIEAARRALWRGG